MFSFTRFCLRVLADLNEIIRRMKRKVILTIAIKKILSIFMRDLGDAYFPYLQQVTVSAENFGNAVLLQRFHPIFFCLISDDFNR